ncbi:MAG: NAD(P)/FAD-dependent oxidoreductase [Acidimicrobiales bacterium]
MTAPMYDVAIVGGGIVGCAIAHELGRHPLAVVLLEREAEVGFGTSKANSGIIHGGHHAAPDTLKGRLEWAGNQRWGELCAELGFGFRRVGELTVALSPDDEAALDRLCAHAEAKGIDAVERWTADQVRRAEPNVNPDVLGAVHAPLTGVVNPYEACYGLAESAAANGVDIRGNQPVQALRDRGDHWEVGTPGGWLAARYVVNAAGLGAGGVTELAGLDPLPITIRKGEEYLLDKRLAGLVQRVIYPCPTPVSKGTLVIPTFDGTIMIGPTADVVDDPEDRTTTVDGAARVLAGARRLVPGIDEHDIIAAFAGSRAALAGEDFLIGPTPAPRFLQAAGIQSPGLTAAPAIAELVVELLADAGLDVGPVGAPGPVERPVHAAALTLEELGELAARDGRFGRVVCRCEFVTEGEIAAAIDRGACTLDGVKFRTRAGMGRCQGGFCTPRCLELLAAALDVPMSAVTKRGGDSWIVLDRSELGR